MKWWMRFAIGSFSLAGVGVQFRCVAQRPIAIPGPGDGYQISKSDSSQPAPAGFEGRTEISSETAVGNTPATAGKRVVAKFILGNQIRTCPHADGTADGEGVFSLSLDYTDAQEQGTTTSHIEMVTKGKYKGQVGDDALLHGPVNADFDYSFSQTGSFRDKSGAIASTAPTNIQQHITIPVLVMPNMKPPDFGAFSGGDPTKGHYAEAWGTGMALGYWAGVYYSIAQIKWYGGEPSGGGTSVRAGQCVAIAFDPPSYTLQPPLGAQAHVNAVVKTKGGEVVPAHFVNAHPYSGSTISPSLGDSGNSAPLQFIYTAPGQKAQRAGFGVGAFTRAGTATGEWKTGLGTSWSGQITYEKTYTGDEGGSAGSQEWSNSYHVSVLVTVADGSATYHGHDESKGHLMSWHPVAKSAPAFDYSEDSEEYGDGEFAASAVVHIDEDLGTYAVSVGEPAAANGEPIPTWGPIGKAHWVSCYHVTGCKTYDRDISVPTIDLRGPLSGKLQDPNHIQASYTQQKTELGRSHKGVLVETTTVNLARSGTTNRSGRSKQGGS